MVTLDIRFPRPVAELIRRDPILRRLVEQVAEKSEGMYASKFLRWTNF